MISVCCFKWGTKYTAEHVNALARMVERHYKRPHRFICCTTEPEGLHSSIEWVPDTEDFAKLRSPHGGSFPSCYRRLRLWREDAAETFGERIVCIDIDVVAVADLAPLWDRPEPIVAYADPLYAHRGQVCGSMLLLSAGARPSVWSDFDPVRSPVLASAAGFKGSDQAWLSLNLRDVPRWSKADGVYSYRADIVKRGGELPADARLTIWHGGPKPWTDGQRLEWVRGELG